MGIAGEQHVGVMEGLWQSSGGKSVGLVCCSYLSVLKPSYLDGPWHVLVLSVVLLNWEASVNAVLRILFVHLLK